VQAGALPAERVVGVETGLCPHSAVRDDISINLNAVEDLLSSFPDLELLLIESGGDNLAATFSPELVDYTILRDRRRRRREDPAQGARRKASPTCC